MYLERNFSMKNIVCFGDSNTYGYDPRAAFGTRYPDGTYWVDILHAKTGWKFWNMGVCGREIPHTSFQIQTACAELASREPSADALWIMLGTNDLLSGEQITAETVGLRMEAFLTSLLNSFPVRKLRLITPVKMRQGTWTTPAVIEESEKLQPVFRSLADRLHISLTQTEGWEIPLAFDGVHFTEQGHRKFAENLLRDIPLL
jgi:lysophospholipase L1-like esterase